MEIPLELGAVEKHVTQHWFIDPKRDMDKLKDKNKEAHRRAMLLLNSVKGSK